MSKKKPYRYVFTVHERSEHSDPGGESSYSLIIRLEGFDLTKAKYEAKKLVEKNCASIWGRKYAVELREVEEL